MARPIPISAAATVMTNRAKICPVSWCRYCENATRFTLTAFSISSIDIRTRIAFRRASTPYTPAENSMADRSSG